jgi:hypothetical protein
MGWLQSVSCWFSGHSLGPHRYVTTNRPGRYFPEVTVESFAYCSHCGRRVSLGSVTGPDWPRIYGDQR